MCYTVFAVEFDSNYFLQRVVLVYLLFIKFLYFFRKENETFWTSKTSNIYRDKKLGTTNELVLLWGEVLWGIRHKSWNCGRW